MAKPSSTTTPLALAICMIALTAGTWWWRSQVFAAKRGQLKAEHWERIKEKYPTASGLAEPASLPPELMDAVLNANPFSADRRPVQAAVETKPGGAEATVIEPPTPQFVYKGRINLGTRQRAIVEDTANHKTYFLEVGQEVAGFKVLDMVENRVVLSNLKTNEEVVVSLASTAQPATGVPAGSGGPTTTP